MDWQDYITADPNILVGKPIIKGTRLSAEQILERMADGWSQHDLLNAYPKLTPEAIQAVCALSLELLREERFIALGKNAALRPLA